MVLVDLFYPDNVKKREQVSEYLTRFRVRFEDFKKSWNTMCTSFNNAVKQKRPDWVLQKLDYNPTSQEPDYILKEIKRVLEDAINKVPKLEQDLDIKDIAGVFEKTNAKVFQKSNLEKFKEIHTALASIFGIFQTSIVICVIVMIVKHAKPVYKTVVKGIQHIGVLGLLGLLVGGIAVTLLISAIWGAIESEKLEKAIKELRTLNEECIEPLGDMRRKIDGINQNIADGIYKIDEHFFIKDRELKEDLPAELQRFFGLNTNNRFIH
ncbi:3467_t:CDS:1 [Paraglomus occultum]|uniref:3467_t:CDS:1 n=1 Tax=Paraglomus occultum TaxID=144539 RepID=A0A9N8ZQT9_9GLOM|nr:3467_t:CDS:1 [Paraglomus occultum]